MGLASIYRWILRWRCWPRYHDYDFEKSAQCKRCKKITLFSVHYYNLAHEQYGGW